METDTHCRLQHKDYQADRKPREEHVKNGKGTRDQSVETGQLLDQGEKDPPDVRSLKDDPRLAGKRGQPRRNIVALGTLRAATCIVLVSILVLFASPAWAWTPKTIARFASGWASGLAAHEAGHYAVGAQSGASVEFEGVNQGSPSLWFEGDRTPVRNTAAGGFMVQVTTTELMLEQENRGAYQLGWICYNIANAFSYTLKDQVYPEGHGDLATMDDHGMDSDAAGAVLVAHAALSAYRLAGGPDGGATPWFEFDPEGNSVAFGFMWRF